MDANTNISYPKQDLQWIEKFARLLDSKFQIPGTRIKFGLDPLFSLVPFLGDGATFVISSMLVWQMYSRGASQKVVIKMMINVFLDTIIGAIPLVGTIFDIFFKANNRNVRLLKEHYQEGKHEGSGKGTLIIFLVVLISITAFILWVVARVLIEFFQWLF